MTTGWKTRALEEVCQFSNGLWKGEQPPFVNVGVIRNTNFTKEGTLDDSDIAYIDVEVKKFEQRLASARVLQDSYTREATGRVYGSVAWFPVPGNIYPTLRFSSDRLTFLLLQFRSCSRSAVRT